MTETSNHKRFFLNQDKKMYSCFFRAQKLPDEALLPNKTPFFAALLQGTATFRDLYSVILETTERVVKKFVFRVPSTSIIRDSTNTDNDTSHEEITYTYYGSDDQIETYPDLKSADTPLCSTDVDNVGVIEFRLAVTGADWLRVLLISRDLDEQIDPGDLPMIRRGIITVSHGTDKDDEENDNKTNDKNNKKIDFQSLYIKDSDLAEADEERYFRKLLDNMMLPVHTIGDLVFSNVLVIIADMFRLHKVMKLQDKDNRDEWSASIIYTCAKLNENDPLFNKYHVDITQLLKRFNIPDETLQTNYKRLLQCFEEEERPLEYFSLTSVKESPHVSEMLKTYEKMIKLQNKEPKQKRTVLKFTKKKPKRK